MKITAIEKIIIENFAPFKVIDIYHKGKWIYTYITKNTVMCLAELKYNTRHQNKIQHGIDRLRVQDENGHIYKLAYGGNYLNIAENYRAYKVLLEYLTKTQSDIIEMTTASETKRYVHKFKIIRRT